MSQARDDNQMVSGGGQTSLDSVLWLQRLGRAVGWGQLMLTTRDRAAAGALEEPPD